MRRKWGRGQGEGERRDKKRREEGEGTEIVSITHPGISGGFEIKTIKLLTPIRFN